MVDLDVIQCWLSRNFSYIDLWQTYKLLYIGVRINWTKEFRELLDGWHTNDEHHYFILLNLHNSDDGWLLTEPGVADEDQLVAGKLGVLDDPLFFARLTFGMKAYYRKMVDRYRFIGIPGLAMTADGLSFPDLFNE